MNATDPIADMLTRLRNAASAKHATVTIPFSKVKLAITKVMEDEGYIADFEIREEDRSKVLVLNLKYDERRQPVITGLRRVSRPGLRVYAGMDDIPRLRGGLGTVVVSTNRGIMTGREARRRHLGGELLAEIW